MNNENGYYDTYFQLDADIAYDPDVLTLDFDNDGTPESNFPGINKQFGGTFDGKNHTISGIRIDKGGVNYQGLFGENDGTVKNVTVSNANISGYSHVGGIVGKNTGTIENCHATATVTVNASAGYAGGIVGENSSSISGCTSAATVRGMYAIGGIAGYNGSTIADCLANGVRITATNYKGGAIVGENNCYEGACNAILSCNYYSGCTVTIGSNSPATTNIGCGHNATEDYNNGTYTPTDVTEMTVNSVTYTNGAAIPTLILADDADNTSIIDAHNGETVNVMLAGRTLYKDGKWNTLCLPFNLDLLNDVRDNTDSPLHGATIMTFEISNWFYANGQEHAQHNDGNVDGCHRSGQIENGSLYLYFFKDMEGNHGYSSNTAAGEPFLVKWEGDGSDNIVNPVFKGVTISNATGWMNPTTTEGFDEATRTGNITFKATYAPVTFDAADQSVLFMGANNTLYYPDGTSTTTIGAFRAYFQLNNGLSAGNLPANAIKMFFGGDNETTDGLTPNPSPVGEGSAGAWYDLQGRKIRDERLEMRDKLPPGIYIHRSTQSGASHLKNGKKVVIK